MRLLVKVLIALAALAAAAYGGYSWAWSEVEDAPEAENVSDDAPLPE